MSKKLPFGSLVFRENRGLFYWRYTDESGKRIWRSTEETDEDKALDIARNWAVAELASREGLIKIKKVGLGISLTEASERYFDEIEKRVSKRHLYMIAYYLDKAILPFFGYDTPVDSINSPRISEFQRHLLLKHTLPQVEADEPEVNKEGSPKKQRAPQPMQPQSVNKVVSILSQMFRYCAVWGEIAQVPFIARMSEQKKKHGTVLNENEINLLLLAASKVSRDAVLYVVLGLYSGLRNSEAKRVCWEEVQWKEDVILLHAQKNKSAMPAPLGITRDYLENVPEAERHGVIVGYQDPIHGRRPILELRRTWATIKKLAGLPAALRFHDLRHTFCTWAYESLGPAEAQILARHSSRSANDNYIHAKVSKVMQLGRSIYPESLR